MKILKRQKKINWAEDVISVALGELGVPTLQEVYDMSWAEFRIRLFAYRRMQKRQDDMMRLHAYHAATGGLYTYAPDKFPKTLDQFWSMNDNTNREDKFKSLIEAQEKYKELKQKKNV